MQEYLAAIISGGALAVAGWRILSATAPRRRKSDCRPYLGEFVPLETEAQREDRTRWVKLQEMLGASQ